MIKFLYQTHHLIKKCVFFIMKTETLYQRFMRISDLTSDQYFKEFINK
jgi:hypothetical protein